MSKRKVVRRKNWVQDWFEAILFAFVVAMIIRNYTFQNFKIPTGSMESTLLVGDYLVANKLKYYFTDPEREDIITFRHPAQPEEPEPRDNFVKIIPPIYWNKTTNFFTYYERMNIVKRIIGMPGDKVQMINKDLYLNDVLLEEEYYVQHVDHRQSRRTYHRDNFGPYIVPEGSFFVLGDNRDQSLDSRFLEEFGFLSREDITGSPLFIFFSKGDDGIRWNRIFKVIR